MINQILCNSSNSAQLINWSSVQHIWSNTQLTRSTLQCYGDKYETTIQSEV